jgi:hypothetical protein
METHELDALVFKTVFGQGGQPPAFGTDIGVAWAVADYLRELGYLMEFRDLTTGSLTGEEVKYWGCGVTFHLMHGKRRPPHPPNWYGYHIGRSTPRAICLATLMVFGVNTVAVEEADEHRGQAQSDDALLVVEPDGSARAFGISKGDIV